MIYRMGRPRSVQVAASRLRHSIWKRGCPKDWGGPYEDLRASIRIENRNLWELAKFMWRSARKSS